MKYIHNIVLLSRGIPPYLLSRELLLMNVATIITIQAVQANTKQIQKGFRPTTLNGKAVGNIHELTTGEYGVSCDMSSRNTFIKALGHIVQFVKAAAQPACKVSKAVFLFALLAAVMVPAAHAIDASDVKTANGGDVETSLAQAHGEISGLSQDVTSLYSKTDANAQAITDNAADQAKRDTVQNQHLYALDTAVIGKVDKTDFDADQARQDEQAKVDRDVRDNADKALENTIDKNKSDQDAVNAAQSDTDAGQNNHMFSTDKRVNDNTQAISDNSDSIRGVRQEQAAQGQFVQQNSANIAQNRQVINQHSRTLANHESRIGSLEGQTKQNRDDIQTNKKNISRVGAMAQAISGLHYDANNTGIAVAAGTYDGSNSLAMGSQFNTTERSAATVGVSYDGNVVGANAGWHTSF